MPASVLEVLITGNSAGLTSALTKASASTKAFQAETAAGATATTSALGRLSPAFIAVGAAAAIGIAKGISATTEWAGEVRSLQRVTGQSAESASSLAAAGEHLGISVTSLTTGFGLLAKNIANGSTNFEKYGIATTDAQGNTLGFDAVLANVADKFATLKPGTDQAAFAMNVFGRSGKTLIPILQRGSAGLAELADEARKAGLVMSQDDLDAAKELTLAQHGLSEAFKGASISIGKAFVPAMTEAVRWLTVAVDVFVAIPTPVKAAAFGIAALTGAIAALQFVGGFFARTWGSVATTLGLSGGAGTEAAAGVGAAGAAAGASLGTTEALTVAVGQLAAALQAQAGAAVEATGALVGYGTTASGLIVPERALAAATAETDAALGAGTGAGGIGATLSTIGVLGGVAAAGLALVAGEMIVLRRDAAAAHDEFRSGIAADLAKLQQGGTRVARPVRILANTPVITSNPDATGTLQRPTAAILAQNRAIDQASQALAEYRQQQLLTKGSSDSLAKGIAGLITPANFSTTALTDIAGATDLLNAGLDKATPMFETFASVTGQSTDTILSSLSAVVNDAKSTPEQVAQAYVGALQQMRAANQQWHDDLVSAFGGAGGALDKFANRSNVDIDKAIGALDNYTTRIHNFGDDVSTIQDRFGKRAGDFLQWATSQGLAQQGLVHAVATASKADARTFIGSWQSAQNATNTLATAIQKALDPVFHNIIDWLKTVVNAITGVPPIKFQADTSQAKTAISGLQAELNNIPAHKLVDILVHTHAGSPWPDEALTMHLFDPLRRQGAKQINGVWTVPLNVAAHTDTSGLRFTGNGRQGFQDLVGTSETAFDAARKVVGHDRLHDLLAGIKSDAIQHGVLNLSKLTAILQSSDLTRKEIAAWHKDAQQAFRQGLQAEVTPPDWIKNATTRIPRLPEGHTRIDPNRHGGRDELPIRLRVDRKHFDDQLAYQTEYGRGY